VALAVGFDRGRPLGEPGLKTDLCDTQRTVPDQCDTQGVSVQRSLKRQQIISDTLEGIGVQGIRKNYGGQGCREFDWRSCDVGFPSIGLNLCGLGRRGGGVLARMP
jgi:hypothetical protein